MVDLKIGHPDTPKSNALWKTSVPIKHATLEVSLTRLTKKNTITYTYILIIIDRKHR